MSKNMTRKGLAFGAGFALVTSGLAVMPAQAAGNINDNNVGLVPLTGTQYGMLLDNVFDLKTTVSTAAAVGTASVKYKVTDPDEELLFDYDGDTGTNTDAASTRSEANLEDGANNRTDLKITGAGTATATIELRFATASGYQVGDVITVSSTAAVSDIALDIDALNGIDIDLTSADSGTAGDDVFTVVAPNDASFADVQAGDTITFGGFVSGDGTYSGGDETDVNGVAFEVLVVTDADSDGFAESFTMEAPTSLTALDITSGSGAEADIAARTDTLDADAEAAINGTHELTFVDNTAGQEVIRFVVDDTAGDLANVTGLPNTSDITNIDIVEVTDGTDSLDDRTLIINSSVPFGNNGLTGLPTPTRATDKSFVIDTVRDAESTNTDILRLVSTSTDTHTVTVQAWVDANDNGIIEDTEDASSVRTITFVPFASAGATVTVEQPIAGLATWKANVSFADTINASQIGSSRLALGLGVLEAGVLDEASGGSTVSAGAFTAEESLSYNSTNNYWGLGTSGTAGVAVMNTYPTVGGVTPAANQFNAGFTYVAELVLDGTPQGNRVFKSTSTAVSDTVGNVSADRTDNVKKVSSTSYTVRAKTTSLTAYAKVTKNDVVVANAPVEVTITRNNLDAKSTITAGGKTLTSTTTGGSISFSATTGADGLAVVQIANSQGKAADSIAVTITQAGESSTATTFAWAAPTDGGAEFNRDGNFTGSDGTDALAITQGSAINLNYNVFDEFGAQPATSHRVLITYTPIGNVDGAAQDEVVRSATVTNNVASFALTDTSTIVGSYTIAAKLQKLNTATGNYDLGNADTLDTTVYVQSNITPATLTVVGTAAGTAALEPKALVAVDLRADKNQDEPAYTDAGRYNVTGSLTNSSGVPIAGAQVTLTAPAGTAFEVGDAYTLNTATVTTSATGSYSAKLFSQLGGKFNVTATSGAVSATTTTALAFPAAETNTGTSLTLDMPEFALPGSSFTVTATLTDKYGNPVPAVNGANNVEVAVDYTGPGVTVGTLPTSFNAAGELKFNVLLGTNDSGTVTVTVSYDGDDRVSTNTSTDLTVSRSLTVGSGVGYPDVAPLNAWTVNQGDGTAKVYVKFPTIGEKVRIGHQTGGSGSYETIFVKTLDSESDSALTVNAEGSYIVRTIDLVDGTNRIRVTVGDSTEVQVRYNE